MNICFVTEIDIDKKIGGAIINDLKTLNCLRKLGKVDIVYLQREKHRTAWLAFPVFVSQILQSSSESYNAYFSRGLFASFLLLLLKPVHRKRVIHHALSVPFPSIEVKYSKGKSSKLFKFIWLSLIRFLEIVVTLNADSIVVAADSYADELLRNGVKECRVQTVTFYVEDEFFQQPIKPSEKETFTFCYVGGFHPYHELLPVIEAFGYLSKENDDLKLYLVGDGSIRPEIEREVSRRKLTQKVKFLGRLPHSSIPNFLSEVDSFIILMHKPGISTSLLEAAAAGKAIITLKRRDDVTLDRYFRDGKEILLVKDTSPTEIAEAMKIISENPQIRSTLSLGARKVARQYFSEEVSLRQLKELMQKFHSDLD